MTNPVSKEHTVIISKDAPVQDVHIHPGDVVYWRSRERDACLVVFEQGSPFERWHFEVPGHGTQSSGPAIEDREIPAGDHLVYKYSVIFNGWTADPKVKVWP
jgi:hypothetical protein